MNTSFTTAFGTFFFGSKWPMTSSANSADSQVEEVSQRVKEAEESVAKVQKKSRKFPGVSDLSPQKNGGYVVVEHDFTMKNRN